MAEQLFKLSPDRDLQCYFLTPSAIAAISSASPGGFIISGKWRQQFDWAVVEWSRDNVFEHPALRYLPDGDLSGLTLSYVDQRSGCIPFESNLFPVIAWDKLRIWATNADGTETVYYVPLLAHATPIASTYKPASATMTLIASPGAGNRVGLWLLEDHRYCVVQASDTLSTIAAGIAADINLNSTTFTATSTGPSVIVSWHPASAAAPYANLNGTNGNRITIYGFAQSAGQVWQQTSTTLSGGQFPAAYQVVLNFGNLQGTTDAAPNTLQAVPTKGVRKMRWTWSADLQASSFSQTEFQVTVSNWSVTGSGRQYFVAGPGSRRIEDVDSKAIYSGSWQLESGNYSGSRIHYSNTKNDSVTISYAEAAPHTLYLGTRFYSPASDITVSVDQGTVQTFKLDFPGEDTLVRLPLGSFGPGTHSLVVTNQGSVAYQDKSGFYFDFLEIAYPSADLPVFPQQRQLTLATDWDTYHAQSLPAERTAWMIQKLGFFGRQNHYTGALWFYELIRTGTQYATSVITFTAQAGSANQTTMLQFGGGSPLSHLILSDDTPATVAQAFASLINLGSNQVWASANGNQLTLTARYMGTEGNSVTWGTATGSQGYVLSPSSGTLSGGVDGAPYNLSSPDPVQSSLQTTLTAATQFWRTDLTAVPRINRAARDWHQAYFKALKSYGIDVVAAFSTELLNADPSDAVGIAQRYPDDTPVVLNTPAIQTNFSTESTAYWKQVYLDMASLQQAAGMIPYLQSGEVQWWYFPNGSGMTFYDAFTKQQFQAKYGTTMQVVPSNTSDPTPYPNEVAFLPTLIGNYTAAIRSALQSKYPGCRYEVLYPTDTNYTPLNELVNFPNADWTPANLTCLKTESFSFTNQRDLKLSLYSMGVSAAKGFPNSKRSHLVGVGDDLTAWMKEVDYAESAGMESVVLFALDQYCLIGYRVPRYVRRNRTSRQA